MILEGAGVCPLIKIGDTVKGREVTDIRCDRNNVGRCGAFNTVALIIFREGLEMKDAMNPSEAFSYKCDECPVLAKDPNHRSKTKGHLELIKAARIQGDPIIIEGAGICPLVKIGDIVKGGEVVDIAHDRLTITSCRAFNTLAMLRLKDAKGQWYFIRPWRVVGCDSCPILADDPNHQSKTKGHGELIEAAMKRVGLTAEHKEPKDIEPVPSKPEPHGRFELIDLTGEDNGEVIS